MISLIEDKDIVVRVSAATHCLRYNILVAKAEKALEKA
jgi:hypothetical protein